MLLSKINGLFTDCPQRCQWSNNQHVNRALIKHPSTVAIEDIDCHLTTDAFSKKISIILEESMKNTLETKAWLLFLPLLINKIYIIHIHMFQGNSFTKRHPEIANPMDVRFSGGFLSL